MSTENVSYTVVFAVMSTSVCVNDDSIPFPTNIIIHIRKHGVFLWLCLTTVNIHKTYIKTHTYTASRLCRLDVTHFMITTKTLYSFTCDSRCIWNVHIISNIRRVASGCECHLFFTAKTILWIDSELALVLWTTRIEIINIYRRCSLRNS